MKTRRLDILALISSTGKPHEKVLYRCDVDETGRITRALDATGPAANTFVTVMPVSTFKLVERDRTFAFEVVRFVSAEIHTFGLRVRDELSEWICDLAGKMVARRASEIEYEVLADAPQPVLNEAVVLLNAKRPVFLMENETEGGTIIFHGESRVEEVLAQVRDELYQMTVGNRWDAAIVGRVTVARGDYRIRCLEGATVVSEIARLLSELELGGEPLRLIHEDDGGLMTMLEALRRDTSAVNPGAVREDATQHLAQSNSPITGSEEEAGALILEGPPGGGKSNTLILMLERFGDTRAVLEYGDPLNPSIRYAIKHELLSVLSIESMYEHDGWG